MSNDGQAVTIGLAARLRAETQALHTRVERTGIMRALLVGELDRPGYVRLLANLRAVYAALEPALVRRAAHPWIAPFRFERLRRLANLDADLAFLAGPAWAVLAPAHETTRAYAERLAAHDDPLRLLAQAYVRYLGDLSGGRIVHRVVRRHLQLSDAALGFYAFPAIPDPEQAAAEFRLKLDALALAPAEADRLVAEARWGFSEHARMFAALAPSREPARYLRPT